MRENSILKNWLSGLPEILQYMVVIALVLVILYVCLMLTRLLGQKKGEQITYDDPEAYEKQVPDLFASTAFRRKAKKTEEDTDGESSGKA